MFFLLFITIVATHSVILANRFWFIVCIFSGLYCMLVDLLIVVCIMHLEDILEAKALKAKNSFTKP